MILLKIVNVLSSMISFLYGFTILLICDLIYIPKISFPGDPFFQPLSNEGIVRCVLSVVAYFSLMFILHYTVRFKIARRPRKFVYINTIAFIAGLFLFYFIGPFILPFNCTSGP